MSQRITITIDGMDGVVRADDAVRILELVFQILESIDANTWAVGTQRLAWRIIDASVKNPFAVTYDGELTRPDFKSPPDVVELFMHGCQNIEQGHSPRFFTPDDVKRMGEVGKVAKHLRALEFRNTQAVHRVAPALLVDHAREILDNPERVVSYGSLEGTLVSLQNHPDKPGARATLLTRAKEESVTCALSPAQADELNDYVDRKTRVILYGRVTYEAGIPKHMSVNRHTIIPPDEKLPTLADVRALGLTIPGGVSIEDFISEQRGDGD